MANNRMYLKCTKCEPEIIEENGIRKYKDRILIAKYYPSSNWCFFLGSVRPTKIEKEIDDLLLNVQANSQDLEDRENEFNEFLDKHRHEDDKEYDFNFGGKNFVIEYED